MFVSRGWMSMLAAQSNYNDTRCVPDSEAYITALYFTTTSLTTVGFGNVAANTKESFVVAISCKRLIRYLLPWPKYCHQHNNLFVTMSTNIVRTTKNFSMKKYLR